MGSISREPLRGPLPDAVWIDVASDGGEGEEGDQ